MNLHDLAESAAFRGALLDMLLAGMGVLIALAIIGLLLELRLKSQSNKDEDT